MNRNQRIRMRIVWLALILLLGSSSGIESHAQNSDSDTACQEFLEGKRLLYIDEEAHQILEELSYCGLGGLGCGAFSMKEILEKLNECYYENYEENNRIACIEYAYLGSGKNQKLAVRFDARMQAEDFQLTFIIVYKDGKLFLRHALESWSRNSISINQYGYIWNFGSSGAFAGGSYEALINDSGRADYVFERDFYWSDIEEPEICQQIYGTEEYFFEQVSYRIQEKAYALEYVHPWRRMFCHHGTA